VAVRRLGGGVFTEHYAVLKQGRLGGDVLGENYAT
jgi:hypothetical protein